MSGRLLQQPDRPQDRADDLESFVHIIVYLAFRYQESAIPDVDLARVMAAVYDQYVDSDIPTGGVGKTAFFRKDQGNLDPRVVNASFPAPLAGLINDLRSVFFDLYSPEPPHPKTFHSAVKAQRMLAEIEAHTKRVADTLQGLNESSEELLEAFDQALSRVDWPKGENAKPAVDRLPRTYKAELTTQIEHSRQRESQITKRKFDGGDENGGDSSNKRPHSMVDRDRAEKL